MVAVEFPSMSEHMSGTDTAPPENQENIPQKGGGDRSVVEPKLGRAIANLKQAVPVQGTLEAELEFQSPFRFKKGGFQLSVENKAFLRDTDFRLAIHVKNATQNYPLSFAGAQCRQQSQYLKNGYLHYNLTLAFLPELVNETDTKMKKIPICIRLDDGTIPRYMTIECIYIPTKSPYSSGKTTVNAILDEMCSWDMPLLDSDTKQIRPSLERLCWQIALMKGLQQDMICDPYPIIPSPTNVLKEYIIPQYLDPKISFGNFVKDCLRVLVEDENLLFKALLKHFANHIRKDYHPPEKRKRTVEISSSAKKSPSPLKFLEDDQETDQQTLLRAKKPHTVFATPNPPLVMGVPGTSSVVIGDSKKEVLRVLDSRSGKTVDLEILNDSVDASVVAQTFGVSLQAWSQPGPLSSSTRDFLLLSKELKEFLQQKRILAMKNSDGELLSDLLVREGFSTLEDFAYLSRSTLEETMAFRKACPVDKILYAVQLAKTIVQKQIGMMDYDTTTTTVVELE